MNTLNNTIDIRNAVFGDIQLIQDMAQVVFPHTYGKIISKQQIAYMLEMMYSTQALEIQIFDGKPFVIAEMDGEGVGFASFGQKAQSLYRLHKLYVLPNIQQKGTGKLLLKEVIRQVVELGGKQLELNVNKYNKAVGFYQKMGFAITDTIDLNIGNGYFMNDYIMTLELG